MKKKYFAVIAIIVVLVILLTPIRLNLKDGGSVRYKSLVYEATKIHQLALEADGVKPYIDGFEIKIFGITVFRETNETLQTSADTTNPIEEQTNNSSFQETNTLTYEQNEPIIVDNSLVLVQSADTLSKPYENFLWAEKWSENGWLSGDGMSISHKLSDIDNEIPQITYGDDFEIHYREGVEFISLSIYNSDFDRIHHNVQQEVLHTLEEGTYYLAITVKVQGEYIETDEKYEYSGYECAYKLVITKR